MPIRMSGLQSGLDTEALVSALVSSYSLKKDSLVKAQTKLSWKQDKWKTMNTSIYSFYSGKLAAARLSSYYTLKTAKISNSNAATVTAASGAVNGTQTLKVNKLASTGYLTGGVISGIDQDGNTAKVAGDSKLSSITGLSGMASGKINVSTGGKEKIINVTSDMTVDQFTAQLKDAGLNASFDSTNQRFFVSAKESGADHDFSIGGLDGGGDSVLSSLGLMSRTSASIAVDMKGYESIVGAGTDAAKNAYMESIAKSSYNSQISSYNSGIKSMLATNKSLASQNKKLEQQSKYANKYNDMLEEGKSRAEANTYLLNARDELAAKQADGTATEDEKIEFSAINDMVGSLCNDTLTPEDIKKTAEDIDKKLDDNTKTIHDNEEAIMKYYEDAGIDTTGVSITDGVVTIPEGTTAIGADGLIDTTKYTYTEAMANSSPLIAEYKTNASNAYDYAKGMVDAYNVYKNYNAETASEEQTAAYNDAVSKLGISSGSGSGTGAVRIVGADSEIELNGAIFKGNTNNYSINGLTIQATALTAEGESVSITTSTDVDGIYNAIKGMFTEYNKLIKSMDEAYNATSAKGYEPLTSTEKEAMTDDEVKLWEEKIKTSLLRKDSTLGSAATSLKNDMMSSFEIDGKSYSLSSFGIGTLGYFTSGDNEKGVIHIDGDSEDSSTAGNADKLRAMIASDPETVIAFFSQLSSKVYTDLGNRMASSSVSSAYTIYNDKEMATEYSSYKSKISDQEDKVSTWEDYYYKKFTAMESALASLNSQSSSLSGLMG